MDNTRINFKDKYLIGKSGKKYLINSDFISTTRYKKYVGYVPLISFGSSFQDLFNSFEEIYKSSTKGNDVIGAFHKIGSVAYNRMMDIKDITEKDREPAVMWFCALFCNTEDEDLGKWNEALMKEKITDWSEINVLDFFLLARSCIVGLNSAYKSLADLIKETEITRKNIATT